VGKKTHMMAANFYLYFNTKQKYEPGSAQARAAGLRMAAALDEIYGEHRYVQCEFRKEDTTRNEVNIFVELSIAGELCAVVGIWIRSRTGIKYDHRSALNELKSKLDILHIISYNERSAKVIDIPTLARRYQLPPPPTR
jgi:hypothetical protein